MTPAAAETWILLTDSVPIDLWTDLRDLLDAQERDRAARFVHEEDRRDYVLAHALTRTALSALEPRPPGEWRFAAGADGKPGLRGGGPSFNLSHSRGIVGCVVAPAGRLGVDVERLDRRMEVEDLAPVTLTPSELAALRGLPPEGRGERLLRHWTLKEALLKATGVALRRDPRSFGLRVDPPGPEGPLPEDLAGRWLMEQRRIGPALAAVAVEGPTALRWHILTDWPGTL